MASKLRWLAAIALVAAATVASGVGAAQAAPTPGWRITAVYPEDSGVAGIAAASADNAWATENCTRPCHTGHAGFTLRHWNGKQWQIVTPVPAHEVGSDGIGLTWSDAPSPGINVNDASAASPTDIWVIGSKIGAAKGSWPMAVSHWNGAKSTASVLPSVPVPGKTKGEPLSIVASSSDDAWALGYVPGPDGSIIPNDGLVLYHWNGAKWSAMKFTVPRLAGAFSAQIYSIEPIPGTTSLWASGIASVPIPVGGNPGGAEGLILTYGA